MAFIILTQTFQLPPLRTWLLSPAKTLTFMASVLTARFMASTKTPCPQLKPQSSRSSLTFAKHPLKAACTTSGHSHLPTSQRLKTFMSTSTTYRCPQALTTQTGLTTLVLSAAERYAAHFPTRTITTQMQVKARLVRVCLLATRKAPTVSLLQCRQ